MARRTNLGSSPLGHAANAKAALAKSQHLQREVLDYEQPGAVKRASKHADTVARPYDGICVLALSKASSARDFASLAVAEAAHAMAATNTPLPATLQRDASQQLDSTTKDLERIIYRCAKTDKVAQFRGRVRRER